MNKTFILGATMLSATFASSTAPVEVEKFQNKNHFLLTLQAQKNGEELMDKGSPIYMGAGIGFQTNIDEQAFIGSYLISLNTVFGQRVEKSTENEANDKGQKSTSTSTGTEEVVVDTSADPANTSSPMPAPSKYPIISNYNIIPTLKISAIKYFDPGAEHRFFVSTGPYLSYTYFRNSKTTEIIVEDVEDEDPIKEKTEIKWDVTEIDFGATIGFGMEFGDSTEIVSTFKIEYFQPLFFGSKAAEDYFKTERKPLSWETGFKNLGSVALTYTIGF